MARVERVCPAMGLTPIPACDIIDIGNIHDVNSFEQYFAPTQWLYAKGSDQIHERCEKEDRLPLGICPNAVCTEGNSTGPISGDLYDVSLSYMGIEGEEIHP